MHRTGSSARRIEHPVSAKPIYSWPGSARSGTNTCQ
jgi:hypothetical protein